MAAAVWAAESGAQVGVIDDNPKLGGQIWRGVDEKATGGHNSDALPWLQRLRASGGTVLCGLTVFDRAQDDFLIAESASPNGTSDIHFLRYKKLILATGARERFLPFPGWTLPSLVGVGGLQAMVKSGLPIRGKRVVIAGTGPLLPAVAAYLIECGAEIPAICEQASWWRLLRFGVGLWRHPSKIAQAFQLRPMLKHTRFSSGTRVVRALGRAAVESVEVIHGDGRKETISCDYLACSFHLVPNLELPLLLGCKIDKGQVQVNDFQQTSVANIWCAGEPTGIGGVEKSLIEGQIAGLAAAGRTEEARKIFGDRVKHRKFAAALDRAFALSPELSRLCQPDTIVCRCEDVPYSRLAAQTSWRAAKLHTRCGMGPCQGRICGPAAKVLFGWNHESMRPPLYPVSVESLAASSPPSHLAESVSGVPR